MLAHDTTKTWTHDGHTMLAQISPCSWMYESYGLQISIHIDGDMGNGGALFRHIRKPLVDCTQEDFDALVSEPVTFVKCSKPGCTRERVADPKSNRCVPTKVKKGTGQYGGDTIPDPTRPLCEECFTALLDAEFAKEQAKEKAHLAKHEMKLYAQGFRWAVDAWIHPRAGGDDYQITYYFHDRPGMDDVRREVGRKSRRTDDVAEPRPIRPVAPVAARRAR